MKTGTWSWFTLAALCGLLYFTNLGGYDLWPPDEPRFAQVAREMLDSGDYGVPRINGEPYQEKPPLMLWTIAALSAPVGDVNEWTARIPSAVSGTSVVLLTFGLARAMAGTPTGITAALIVATFSLFWWEARVGQLDMMLAAFMMLAAWCLWHWEERKKSIFLVGLYAAMAAGAMVKGPAALVFPVLAGWAFYWRRKEARKQTHWFIGIACATLPVFLWLAMARMAVSVETSASTSQTVAENVFRQTLQRFFMGVTHANWPWYYLEHLPLNLLPWTLFLPWTLHWAYKNYRTSKNVRFLVCWSLPALLFFSAAIEKRAIYLLPTFPFVGILIALTFQALEQESRTQWFTRVRLIWVLLLVILGALPMIALVTPYRSEITLSFGLFTLFAWGGAAAAILFRRQTLDARLAIHIAVTTALLLASATVSVLPVMNQHKSVRPFCAPLRALVDQGCAYDLFSLRTCREEYTFYAKHFAPPVLADSEEITGKSATSNLKEAALLFQLLKVIERAADKAEFDVAKPVSDAQLETLRTAIREAAAKKKLDTPECQGYETQMASVVKQLLDTLASPKPGFVIALERDWRWVLAFVPEARALTVAGEIQDSGHRVLLLANAAGRNVLP